MLDWAANQWNQISTDALWAIASMAVVQRASQRFGMWAYAIVALPGTFAHELAHFVAALLLHANAGFPSLWPEKVGHSWRLGSVQFRAPWWRAMPIALAPVALLPLSLWWAGKLVSDASGGWFWLHGSPRACSVPVCPPGRTFASRCRRSS
ncbi:hypothetical protein ACFFGH_09115 [Lysobacter korlensis]|uniref:Peptidase M50 domain-containing protein n=1 Tax=Lysobacter korlensis TaxID=553636 RepID=A0ABV6RLY7_9GAMM